MREPTIKELRLKYPFIVAQGRRWGSFPYYVNEQLRKAYRDNAPEDAVSCITDAEGNRVGWRTMSYYDETSQENLMAAARNLNLLPEKKGKST